MRKILKKLTFSCLTGAGAEAYSIGTQWCIRQCRDLIAHGAPAVHFYTMGKSDNICKILENCF